MNGWRRLWVLCCAVLILAPVYVYDTYIPSDEKLNWDNQERIDRQLADIKIIEEPEQGSNRIIREVMMLKPVAERLADIEKTKAHHAEFMANVRKQRPILIAQLAGAWLAACAMLYLSGMGVAWVIRGFRKKSSA